MPRYSIHSLRELKTRGQRFAMITAYDFPVARARRTGRRPHHPGGRFAGQVVLGYDSTVPVTMDDMLHHTRAVVRGTERAMVVADMPFMSYQANADDAMRNAGRLLQEGGARRSSSKAAATSPRSSGAWSTAGIPVMGHLGLTPQSVNQFGGHKVQGSTPAAAARLVDDAWALEEAGAFAIVLETIPAPLAEDGHRTAHRSPPSASAPARIATARCRSSTTCSASTTTAAR